MIEAHGLGKMYHRGYFARRFGKRRGSDEFWALKDIDLELRQGESLGIIGANGAGKSTLLKILSRVTTPTEGWMTVRGRVGALIELGAGFHAELSGRDNVYIAGSILGMSRREITRRFDEIIDFAEIGEFIDMPVKKYSSGMFVRLGFAVAAHMDPDILLVDEVLAVGDSRFQKKCFEAMQKFRRSGVPVVLVSHFMYNIQRNCGEALLLSHGRVQHRGEVGEVINAYQEMVQEETERLGQAPEAEAAGATGEMRISRVTVCDDSGAPCTEFDPDSAVRIWVDYETRHAPHPYNLRVAVMDGQDNVISVNDTLLEGRKLWAGEPQGRVGCRFPRLALTSGQYYLQITLLDETTQVRHDLWRGLQGREELRLWLRPDAKSASFEQWQGLVNLDCEWLEGRPGAEARADGAAA